MISPRIAFSVLFGLILAFSAYVLFTNLGTEPFQDYDEATYAQVTKESLLNGNPVSLSFLNQPYFRKPPFLFWLTTSSSELFSDTEFAVRFPSALAGFITIVLVILVCIEAGVTLPFALLAGAVLATTSTWMEFARDVRFDNLVALFVVATFYAGIRAVRNPRWYLLMGAMLALAVLSKSVIAIFGGFAVLAYTLLEIGWRKTFEVFKSSSFWKGMGVFFLVVAPWHIAQTISYGTAFWNSYLGSEVINRASGNLFPGGLNPTNAEYLLHLKIFANPWSEIALASVVCIPFLYRKMSHHVRSVLAASVITAASILIVMFSAKTKAFGYLMPLYPFMAIIIALTASELWSRLTLVGKPMRSTRIAFIVGLAVLIYSGASTTRLNAFHINPYYGWELQQAQDEYAIGSIIAQDSDPLVYTYEYQALGTILYYGNIPQTNNQFIYGLTPGGTAPRTGSFVLATSSEALLHAFPSTTFTPNYAGKFVSLFTVAN